jgi:hypothetical protein
MNEHSFIRSIHRKLPKSVFVWKICDQYAGGVPDTYYSGIAADLWVEYKYVRLPKRDTSKVDFGISELQKLWLIERKREGRNTCLVVGAEEGCLVIFDSTIIAAGCCSRLYFISNAVSKDSVVTTIVKTTVGPLAKPEK